MSVTPWTYPLFMHMQYEHGLTLLESELCEIMAICRELEQKAKEEDEKRATELRKELNENT